MSDKKKPVNWEKLPLETPSGENILFEKVKGAFKKATKPKKSGKPVEIIIDGQKIPNNGTYLLSTDEATAFHAEEITDTQAVNMITDVIVGAVGRGEYEDKHHQLRILSGLFDAIVICTGLILNEKSVNPRNFKKESGGRVEANAFMHALKQRYPDALASTLAHLTSKSPRQDEIKDITSEISELMEKGTDDLTGREKRKVLQMMQQVEIVMVELLLDLDL